MDAALETRPHRRKFLAKKQTYLKMSRPCDKSSIRLGMLMDSSLVTSPETGPLRFALCGSQWLALYAPSMRPPFAPPQLFATTFNVPPSTATISPFT